MFSSVHRFIKPLKKELPYFFVLMSFDSFLKKELKADRFAYRENAENAAFYFSVETFYLVIIISNLRADVKDRT
jgi:hypothetical protein